MARIARVVIPGLPHHVTQRGNRRQRTFFAAEDYRSYRELLAEWCAREAVAVWAHCLMPNHVHLVLVPSSEQSLARAVGEVHRRYTSAVNRRHDWRGFLWQGRFASYPMDETHLLRAVRYVLHNPVHAGLVERAEDWPHSSARAHLTDRPDGLVDLAPLRHRVASWERFLGGVERLEEQGHVLLERHQRTGRPLGDHGFVARLESLTGRRLAPGKRGPRQRPAPAEFRGHNTKSTR